VQLGGQRTASTSLWYFSRVEIPYAFVPRIGCDVLVIEGS
jgi:hypothetical protein